MHPATTSALGPWFIPLLFGVMWPTVLFFISVIGGWRQLASRYRTDQPVPAPRRHLVWGQLGLMYYRNCLTVGGDARGLYLAVFFPFRFFHPPLCIPWSDLHGRTRGRHYFMRCDTFEVGPERVQLRLRSSAVEPLEAYLSAPR